MSITGSTPFNGTADQTVAVAYVAAFILVFFVSTLDATFPYSPSLPLLLLPYSTPLSILFLT